MIVGVGVSLGVRVNVKVGLGVKVNVGVGVKVGVKVTVGVGVNVGVGVAVGTNNASGEKAHAGLSTRTSNVMPARTRERLWIIGGVRFPGVILAPQGTTTLKSYHWEAVTPFLKRVATTKWTGTPSAKSARVESLPRSVRYRIAVVPRPARSLPSKTT